MASFARSRTPRRSHKRHMTDGVAMCGFSSDTENFTPNSTPMAVSGSVVPQGTPPTPTMEDDKSIVDQPSPYKPVCSVSPVSRPLRCCSVVDLPRYGLPCFKTSSSPGMMRSQSIPVQIGSPEQRGRRIPIPVPAELTSNSEDSNREIGLLPRPRSDCVLPTINGEHSELCCISSSTVADLIRGKYSLAFDRVVVVDCRYAYEFSGGHLAGALNVPPGSREADLRRLFFSACGQCSGDRTAVVFHCEFSQNRGPSALKRLRAIDRELHLSCYPVLSYSQLYLMHGGYREFVGRFPGLCEPEGAYVRMRDKRFRQAYLAARGCAKSARQRKGAQQQQMKSAVTGSPVLDDEDMLDDDEDEDEDVEDDEDDEDDMDCCGDEEEEEEEEEDDEGNETEDEKDENECQYTRLPRVQQQQENKRTSSLHQRANSTVSMITLPAVVTVVQVQAHHMPPPLAARKKDSMRLARCVSCCLESRFAMEAPHLSSSGSGSRTPQLQLQRQDFDCSSAASLSRGGSPLPSPSPPCLLSLSSPSSGVLERRSVPACCRTTTPPVFPPLWPMP